MTLEQLAREEGELYASVIQLYQNPTSPGNSERLDFIIEKYRDVHRKYSDLSVDDIEALKRGLFIQWYALTEPSFLTGIGDLDPGAEDAMITSLQKFIEEDKLDSELIWMLNYYANWEWCFDHVKSFKGFDPKIVNEKNNKLPNSIDKIQMLTRGQMGDYWNSLTIFN